MNGVNNDQQKQFANVASIPSASPTPALELSYGDLRLGDLIGHGGNGTVHEVTTPEGQSVALKRPHVATGAARERFLEEATTWSHLAHRYIVRVHASGIDPEPWIVMELADDGTLLDRVGTMRVDEALWTSIAITEAVRYAHERGVMHYDLKPENVLLSSTPDSQWSVPKVTDWGLSELLLTQEGKPKGLTYSYAAPEQFDRGTQTDSRTDIYQLGATIYALLTGRPPVTGSQKEIVTKVRAGKWPAPTSLNPTLPRGIDRILGRALATDPDERYESVLLLKQALESLFWDAYTSTSVTHQGVTPRRTGTIDAVGPATTPSKAWCTRLEAQPVGSPIVTDGRAYVTTADGRIVVLEVSSGGVLASLELSGRPLVGAELVGEELRVLTDDPAFYRLGTDPFEGLSRVELTFDPRSGFLTTESRAYLTTNARELLAFDIDSGVSWQAALPGHPGGLIAASADHVIVPTYDGTVCLNVEDGSRCWIDETHSPHRSPPAVTADAVVVCGRGSVAELDVQTGTARWRLETSGRGTGVALTETMVYVGTTEGKLLAVDRSTGNVKWTQTLKGRVINQPYIAGGRVYIGCMGQNNCPLPPRMDSVFAFDADNGTRCWALSSDGAVVGSPVVIDEALLLGTDNESIIVFDT